MEFIFKNLLTRKLQVQMALLVNCIKYSKKKYQDLVQTLSEIRKGNTSQINFMASMTLIPKSKTLSILTNKIT